MAKKSIRVARTRGAGTLTEAQFWTKIRSALRSASRYWKPILVCKNNSRRLYKGLNKRQRFEYQCSKCKKWFKEKEISVDHIVPCGALNSYNDIPRFVERLFVEEEGLQVLCDLCHNEKTNKERRNEKKD